MPLATLKTEKGEESIIQTTVNLVGALAIIGLETETNYSDEFSNNEVVDILLTPNSLIKNFLHVALETSNGADFYLYEDVTGSGGSAMQQFNPNREASNDIGVSLDLNPTVSDTGTLILNKSIGSRFLEAEGEKIIILNRDMKYLIRVESTNMSNDITLSITCMVAQED